MFSIPEAALDHPKWIADHVLFPARALGTLHPPLHGTLSTTLGGSVSSSFYR